VTQKLAVGNAALREIALGGESIPKNLDPAAVQARQRIRLQTGGYFDASTCCDEKAGCAVQHDQPDVMKPPEGDQLDCAADMGGSVNWSR
jgi:hypothetical protein